MPHYIKVTGKGYLKNINDNWDVDRQNMFSKQLTLSYCNDSKTQAETYRNHIVRRIKSRLAKYDKAIEAIDFINERHNKAPFKSNDEVLTFIEQIFPKNYDESLYSDLKNCFNGWRASKGINVCFTDFRGDSYYSANHIIKNHKSLVNTCKLISKAKVIETENHDVVIHKTRYNTKWYESANNASDNKVKMPCSTCGAVVPGARYLMIGGLGICPYCLVRYSKEAEIDITKLGNEMELAYKKALFLKKL